MKKLRGASSFRAGVFSTPNGVFSARMRGAVRSARTRGGVFSARTGGFFCSKWGFFYSKGGFFLLVLNESRKNTIWCGSFSASLSIALFKARRAATFVALKSSSRRGARAFLLVKNQSRPGARTLLLYEIEVVESPFRNSKGFSTLLQRSQAPWLSSCFLLC